MIYNLMEFLSRARLKTSVCTWSGVVTVVHLPYIGVVIKVISCKFQAAAQRFSLHIKLNEMKTDP